jgi:hypothetical protein
MRWSLPRLWPTARAALCEIGLIAVVINVCTLGCNQTRTLSLVDSEHRQFSTRCDKNGTCTLALITAPNPDESRSTVARETFTLRGTGRVVGVCSSTTNVADCRPLVCVKDAECPPAQGLDHGVCVNQLCTEPSHGVLSDDAIMLCLAGTGTAAQTPLQVERFALGLNCGTPCQIPKPCRPL